ncbi:hypothetical protein HWI92_15450 [Dyadobacter sandarakinus]|uniref:Uncharacterized protein n=2 Tax=Dyadobacter sandarakinus TaxID=2747268 RepID=A0ABX7IE05_9BACT|nr:hypothetical protein HWI92_15450 [Dyadobacter sandarakinus]
MNRIIKKDSTIQITNSRKLVDVRNRIIDGNDSISDDIVWGIVIKHLPLLMIEVEALINSSNCSREI